MRLQVVIYKTLKKYFYKYSFKYCLLITKVKLWLNGVSTPIGMKAKGIPIINVSVNGRLEIGKMFSFNSGVLYNMIGRQQKVMLIIANKGELKIGDNVGMSCSAIICHNRITIGNDVMIGGNCVIYDTDFHSLDVNTRKIWKEDILNVQTRPVVIEDGAFIGAHSTILKGVVIGRNSIIGAGSVVTKSIPSGEVWGGNPAKFIRKIN